MPEEVEPPHLVVGLFMAAPEGVAEGRAVLEVMELQILQRAHPQLSEEAMGVILISQAGLQAQAKPLLFPLAEGVADQGLLHNNPVVMELPVR